MARMLTMLVSSKLVFLALISVGQTLGFAAPTLGGLMFSLSRLRTRSLVAFLPVIYVFLNGLSRGVFQITLLQCAITSIILFSLHHSITSIFTVKILTKLFWFQGLLWVIGALLFDYVGGVSAGGFQIVNDFSLQLVIIALTICLRSRVSFTIICCTLLICYLNDSRLIFVGFMTVLIGHFLLRRAVGRVLGLLFVSGLFVYWFDDVLFFVAYVEQVSSGVACGSICFRIFATDFALDRWALEPFFGYGPGMLSSGLLSLQEAGYSYVMAGSIHNLALEMLAENGVVFIILLFVAVGQKLRRFSLFRLSMFFVLVAAVGQSAYSIGLIFLFFGAFCLKEKLRVN